MSPGANKRQTGTVPKAKTSRKNAVPQEMMVAPTRRDLQQHLNVSISLHQVASTNKLTTIMNYDILANKGEKYITSPAVHIHSHILKRKCR